MRDDGPEQTRLAAADTIEVIGLSRNPKRDSHIVANHRQRNGYRIVPMHPKADRILDETASRSISAIPLAGPDRGRSALDKLSISREAER